MLNILIQDYPDIAGTIANKIETSMPKQRLTDVSLIPVIVKEFERIALHTGIFWSNSKSMVSICLPDDDTRLVKVTEAREMLIAVLLLFYNPEKITGLVKSAALSGLIKNLSIAITCDKSRLSQDVTNVIGRYKAYKSFKKEVDSIYELIKCKGKYFE